MQAYKVSNILRTIYELKFIFAYYAVSPNLTGVIVFSNFGFNNISLCSAVWVIFYSLSLSFASSIAVRGSIAKRNVSMPVFKPRSQRIPKISGQIAYLLGYHGNNILLD